MPLTGLIWVHACKRSNCMVACSNMVIARVLMRRCWPVRYCKSWGRLQTGWSAASWRRSACTLPIGALAVGTPCWITWSSERGTRASDDWYFLQALSLSMSSASVPSKGEGHCSLVVGSFTLLGRSVTRGCDLLGLSLRAGVADHSDSGLL